MYTENCYKYAQNAWKMKGIIRLGETAGKSRN